MTYRMRTASSLYYAWCKPALALYLFHFERNRKCDQEFNLNASLINKTCPQRVEKLISMAHITVHTFTLTYYYMPHIDDRSTKSCTELRTS